MVPWIVAHPGRPRSEIAERFGVSDAQAERDLGRIIMVGAPPFGGGDYIDVCDDGEDGVRIELGEAFRRPLRLHAAEALHLLAAGRALLAVPGAETDGPLASALGKVERALGLPGPDVAIATAPALPAVRAAADDAERIEIDYVAADETATTRRIDPTAVLYAAGEWYVAAYCHRAEDERVFRIDRIRAVRPTGEFFESVTPSDFMEPFRPDPGMPRVTIRVPASSQWLVESLPTETATTGADGAVDVVLAVSDRSWLERLLLRLGPDARVLDPADWIGVGPAAAERVRARYRRS